MDFIDSALRVIGVGVGIIAALFGIVKVWKEATVASSSAQITALQAASDEWRELKEDYRTRLTAAEGTLEAQAGKIHELDRRVHDAERVADLASESEAALLEHHLDTMQKIAGGLIPPWSSLTIPQQLAHRITLADYPQDVTPDPPEERP